MTEEEYAEWVAETNRQMKRFDKKPRWRMRVWAYWMQKLCRIGIHKYYENSVAGRLDLLSCTRCNVPVKAIRRLCAHAGVSITEVKALFSTNT